MARGNPYARGGDVMKTRSERRKEKQAKLSKTKRVIRLKRRLGRIAAKKFAGQEDSHTTALMESYILRRKAERAAEKAKEAQHDGAAGPSSSGAGDEEKSDAEDEEGPEEVDSDGAFSLGSAADDSAFEMSGEDDDGEEPESEEEEDIATGRQRAAEQKRQQHSSRGGRGGVRGGSRPWQTHKESTETPKGRGGDRSRGRGRGGRGGDQRGAGRTNFRGGSSGANFHQRSLKVQTRSLY